MTGQLAYTGMLCKIMGYTSSHPEALPSICNTSRSFTSLHMTNGQAEQTPTAWLVGVNSQASFVGKHSMAVRSAAIGELCPLHNCIVMLTTLIDNYYQQEIAANASC